MKKIMLIILIMFIIFFASCNDKEPEEVIIRLPWIHQAQYAGVYVAKEKGLFEKHGVDTEVKIMQGGPNIRPIDLVSSNSEHFSITGSTPFFNAYVQNRPIKILATFDQKHAFCYFARKDQNINHPKDFKGKRVGHKVMHEHNLIALLDTVNLTKSDVELVPAPTGLSLFLVNDTDKMVPIWPGHAADEPLIAEENGVAVNYFFPEDYDNIPRIGNLLFTSKKFEKNNPEIVQGVVNAIIEGWYYAFDNTDEAVKIVMAYMNSADEKTRTHQKNMLIKMKDFMFTEHNNDRIGWSNRERWEKVFENYTKNRDIKKTFSLDDCLTNKYVGNYFNNNNK